jgi:hypothetical protein
MDLSAIDLNSLPAPVFTTLDGVTQGIAAVFYVAVGIGAWMLAPRDIRTRVFLAFSLANLVVFGVPTFWWLRGTNSPAKLPGVAVAAIMAGLGIGALVLFHFTQVFPRRRPWIRTSGVQMAVAYVVAPLAIAGLVWFAPPTAGALSAPYILAMIVFGFPLLVLLAIVLPVAAMVSLIHTYRELPQAGLVQFKKPMEWILVSQIAGGTLALVFAPVLTVAAPNSMLQSALTILIWLLGLLTPIAFAAAVWKHGLLSISAE